MRSLLQLALLIETQTKYIDILREDKLQYAGNMSALKIIEPAIEQAERELVAHIALYRRLHEEATLIAEQHGLPTYKPMY